jgi:hypothetical protein
MNEYNKEEGEKELLTQGQTPPISPPHEEKGRNTSSYLHLKHQFDNSSTVLLDILKISALCSLFGGVAFASLRPSCGDSSDRGDP